MVGRVAAAVFMAGAYFMEAGAASAQSAPPAPIWQGWYIGLDGGGQSFSGHAQSLTSGAGGDISGSDTEAGVYGGYDWRSGPWVFGVETEWSHTFAKHTNASDFDLFDIRGRAGFTIGSVLFYGTAGIATENRFLGVTKFNSRSTQSLQTEAQHTGFIVGGGMEAPVSQQLSLRGEVLYFDGGKEQYSFPFAAPLTPSTWTRDFSQTIYRAGLTYHFN